MLIKKKKTKPAMLFVGLICLFLLVACGPTNVDDTDPTDVKFGYTEEDLSEIAVRDINRKITVDMSDNDKLRGLLRNLSYNPNEGKLEAGIVMYEITIGEKTLMVCEENTVVYECGNKYPVDPFLHNYLNLLFVGGVQSLNATLGENTKVYNSSNHVAEVEDVTAFFQNLNGLRVISILDVTDFVFDKADYRIDAGHYTIDIYGDIIVIGSRGFAVVEGDYGFLSGLKYSSSSGGFLPWI